MDSKNNIARFLVLFGIAVILTGMAFVLGVALGVRHDAHPVEAGQLPSREDREEARSEERLELERQIAKDIHRLAGPEPTEKDR